MRHVEIALVYSMECESLDLDREMTDDEARVEAVEQFWRWVVDQTLSRPAAFTKVVRDWEDTPIYNALDAMEGVFEVDLAKIPDPNDPAQFEEVDDATE